MESIVNVAPLVVLALTAAYITHGDVLEATIFTGELATLNNYFWCQATEYFTITCTGGDE
jgi:hypothetical protein